MTSLSRRLKRLEASYPSANRLAGEQARNLESAIRERVLQHLSDDELVFIQAIAKSMLEGSFQQGELTDQQRDALRAYNAAFDEECRNAGFTSSADFHRRLKAG